MSQATAEERYNSLMNQRSLYLRRAIDCSKLTIPSLIPESDQHVTLAGDQYNALPTLYQGTGSRGVNTISSKLLLALYPPQQPFFRLMLDKQILDEYAAQQGADQETVASQIDEALSNMERAITQRLEVMQTRMAVFEAIKHLVVGGNGLLYVGADQVRFYSLRSFVVERDPEGNVSEIVVREEISRAFLPEGIMAKINERVNPKDRATDDVYEIYTHVEIEPGEQQPVKWYQEVMGETVPGSAGFSTIEANPWIVLRYYRIAGENYGRGLCEEVIGDLRSLESLTQAIVEGSLVSAKTVFLVNPNGVTRADVLAKAENGAIVAGNIADVEALQVQKAQDYSVTLQTMQIIERRLQFTFMSTESIQRDAERVTAEEVRLMAEQLEQTLGGIYSILSQEMQLPLIRRVVALMERAGELPPLPEGLVQPSITTGLDSIGRGNDKARLTNFLQTLATAIGPEQFVQYINTTELTARLAAADGIDSTGLVKTEQELQAEQAQQQQLMLQQQVAGAAIGATGPGPGGPPQGSPPPAPQGGA